MFRRRRFFGARRAAFRPRFALGGAYRAKARVSSRGKLFAFARRRVVRV